MPAIIDENTGVTMSESANIVEYLETPPRTERKRMDLDFDVVELGDAEILVRHGERFGGRFRGREGGKFRGGAVGSQVRYNRLDWREII
ncbi:hypothetical protein GCM10009000_066700 [Halobacterium noricense]|uniref:GST N-terminal domain-containing protein n=1 Tax=Haladaptatus pallidirubidus TaxID=1008152 RepID=A0AAV3UJX2_9EURY